MFHRRELRPSKEARGRRKQLSSSSAHDRHVSIRSSSNNDDPLGFFKALDDITDVLVPAIKTDSDTTSTTSSAPPRPKKKVRFGVCEARTYPNILVDNPGGSFGGAPIGLDWNVTDTVKLKMEKYEETYFDMRPYIRNMPTKKRTSRIHLTIDERKEILSRLGYSAQDLQKAEDKANAIRAARALAMQTVPYSGYEEDRIKRLAAGTEHRRRILEEFKRHREAEKAAQKALKKSTKTRLLRGILRF